MLYIYFLSSLLHLKLHLGNISIMIYNKGHLLSLLASCLLCTKNKLFTDFKLSGTLSSFECSK